MTVAACNHRRDEAHIHRIVCRVCKMRHIIDVAHHVPSRPIVIGRQPGDPVCPSRGGVLRESPCDYCALRDLKLQVRSCDKHGSCLDADDPRHRVRGVKKCQECNDYPHPKPVPLKQDPIKWAYGVMTVRERQGVDGLLEQTLQSLAKAGFESPRLFIDDPYSGSDYELGYPHTNRTPRIRPWGNMILALWELVLRHPDAQRYALFQDDIVVSAGLRGYLDAVTVQWPHRGYLNLYTVPANQELLPDLGHVGWYRSNQRGKGALALVFDPEGIDTLLSSRHLTTKARGPAPRNFKSIDGGVIQAMRDARWFEYVHNPSLVQHAGGGHTTLSNKNHALATTFMGESYNLMDLLPMIPITQKGVYHATYQSR